MYRKTERTEDRKDEKRKLIFKTAAKVFAQKGYQATAVKDITDDAGISVGTFYLYFRNKEDLFEKLYEEMAEKVSAINAYAIYSGDKVRSVEEQFSRAVASSIWAYLRYRDMAKIMLVEAIGLNPRFNQKCAEVRGKSAENMQMILSLLKDRGYVDIPDLKVAALAYEGSFNVVNYMLHSDNVQELRECVYPLAIFQLQALKVDFSHTNVKRHIDELFEELGTTSIFD